MRLEWEWLDGIDAADPLDRLTWGRLKIHVADDTVTLVREGQTERPSVYVPLYPVAAWLVRNWWSLLYEPVPLAGVPHPGETLPVVRSWLHRHCLRTARAGIALPYFCISSDGDRVRLEWRADPRNRYGHTPVEFTNSGRAVVDRQDVAREVARFVADVLERVRGLADERVAGLTADWRAIGATVAVEAEFCRGAGRSGLDPYDLATWPEGLVEWFEGVPVGQLDHAYWADLLEAPDDAQVKPATADAVRRCIDAARVGAGKPLKLHIHESTAYAKGYALADLARKRMGLAEDSPLRDLQDASEALAKRSHELRETTELPDGAVLGIAGWQGPQKPLLLVRSGPGHRRSGKRFTAARGLFLALFEAAHGPRLVTEAHTWDQRASRAFAAELLAPRAAVSDLFAEACRRYGTDEAEQVVADRYEVSPLVIRRQVENARVGELGRE